MLLNGQWITIDNRKKCTLENIIPHFISFWKLLRNFHTTKQGSFRKAVFYGFIICACPLIYSIYRICLKNPKYRRHRINVFRKYYQYQNGQKLTGKANKNIMCHMSHITCHMSHVRFRIESQITCHLSLMPTATALYLPPANFPFMHSRLVPKTSKPEKMLER